MARRAVAEAISGDDLWDALEDDVDDYLDGSCPGCGAGPDEHCEDWCPCFEDDDVDEDW